MRALDVAAVAGAGVVAMLAGGRASAAMTLALPIDTSLCNPETAAALDRPPGEVINAGFADFYAALRRRQAPLHWPTLPPPSTPMKSRPH